MSASRRWESQHCRRTVILADPAGGGWVLTPVSPRDRVRARWHARTLDLQLAAGRPAAHRRLRAVRAAMLVAPSGRRELATSWENLIVGGPRTPHVPVQWSEVAAATPDIERLVAALRVPQPVPARGVAIANLLLTDGTGPLYQRRPGTALRDGVQDAVAGLDPYSALTDF